MNDEDCCGCGDCDEAEDAAAAAAEVASLLPTLGLSPIPLSAPRPPEGVEGTSENWE